MNFKPLRSTAFPLFKTSGILTLADFVKLQNFLYAHDCLKKNLPQSLIDESFVIVNSGLNTRCERLNHLQTIGTNTILYGTKSIKSKSIEAWNSINVHLHHLKLQDKSKAAAKNYVYKFLLDSY